MKILAIEDNEEMVDDISLALKERYPEARLIATHLGNNGVKLAENECPDVVILGRELPDIDGLEVLRQIRLFSKVPILIVAATKDDADIAKALGWGADEYLGKPFTQTELVVKIKSLIKGGDAYGN